MRLFFQNLSIALLIALATTGCAGIDPTLIEGVLGGADRPADGPLTERTVAQGLKEALRIGSGRAIDRTSRVDGFLADELLRIHLPEELQDMADVLRRIGFSRKLDELEVAMNRAAEKAAGEAREIFVDAIVGMSLTDAFGILQGHDTAATDFLRRETEGSLRNRFQPIIADKMSEVDLYRGYEQLAEAYNALPFRKRPAVNLETYLTDRALDGLFESLADEEQKIRRDPIARTTELLKRVFSSRR